MKNETESNLKAIKDLENIKENPETNSITEMKPVIKVLSPKFSPVEPAKPVIIGGGGGGSTIINDLDVEDFRIGGSDRVETSIELSGRNFKKSDTVFIASSKVYADSLTGGVAAGLYKAPILISEAKLNKKVLKELERLEAKNIYIVGGEHSISKETENILKKKFKNVVRIGGKDRYETAQKIAKHIYKKFSNTGKVLLASGENFPDALTSSAYAIKIKSPVLLTRKNNINEYAKKFIDSNQVKDVTVVGGKNTISDKLYNNISINKARVGGKDRYETAVKFAQMAYTSPKTVYISSSQVFPDALSAVPVAAKNNAPIILANRFYTSKSGIDFCNKKSIDRIFLVGGIDTLSNKVYFDLTGKK